MYGHVLAAFRYGREDLDVLGLTFRKVTYSLTSPATHQIKVNFITFIPMSYFVILFKDFRFCTFPGNMLVNLLKIIKLLIEEEFIINLFFL